jgi:hypothetical protein
LTFNLPTPARKPMLLRVSYATAIIAFVLHGVVQALSIGELPFHEKFEQASIPDGWSVDKSEGTSVTAKDGVIVFDSPADRFAVVKRKLGVDNVTVDARIRDAATLYLVWADGSFVGAGKVSPTPFARFHTVEADGGTISEKVHTGCNGGAPHLLRIQLGDDCVRLQYSAGTDEPEWRTLRTIKRGSQYAGAPRLVVVGKNLGITEDSANLVETDTVGRGSRGSLADLQITATPDEALKMNSDEIRWLAQPQVDPVAELLSQSDRDPTFEQVARYYPEMKNKREIVGVPGQPLDIGTDWLGRIDASPWEGPVAWFEIGEDATPFAEESETVTHRLLDGYVPIVTLATERNGIKYEMTVFGLANQFSPSAELYTYARITAWANGETTNLPKTIAINGKENKKVEFTPDVTPGGMMTLSLRFKHPDPTTAEQISEDELERHRAKAEVAWRDVLAKAAPFDLPDQRVNEAYRAWIVYSMLNADRREDRLHVHDGAGFYEMQYGYSVSLHSMAFDLYRLRDYVKDVLATQIYLQKPDGHYIQECGLQDQGGFILALATHYLITKDGEWMRQNAEPLKKACDWVIARRADAPTEGMCKGLIKFRPYNDYNDPTFNYTGNIYCCQGLEATALALGEIGDTQAAERYEAEGAKYRQDIFDSMDAATFTHDGVKMIPIEPDTRRILKLTNYRGGEYYGLVASMFFENEFFPRDDPRGALYRNMLENHGGLTAGVCEFQEGIDHAYTCGYLLDRLRDGEIRKVLLGFWSFMAYGMTRDTYSPVEVTLYKTGDNHYTLPHTYSCTQQLRLLRYMLLREQDNDLIIAQGIPHAWLEPSKSIEVTEAPTKFGPVSYRIESNSSKSISIHLDPPNRDAAEQIIIYLRHPEELAIADVECTDGAEFEIEGNVIRINEPSSALDLKVTF